MIEVVLSLVVVSLITAFIIVRKPRLHISAEFEKVEKEIEAWLRNPMIPAKMGVMPTSESADWVYSAFGTPTRTTVRRGAIGFYTATQQGQHQLDMT